jgi:integrase
MVFAPVHRGLRKAQLDRRIQASHNCEPWRLHDLRRTAATRMADLGVSPHIVEAVLNHVSGHKRGVAGVYNRATYDSEKLTALNIWAERILSLAEGRGSVVVPLRA